MDLSTPKPCFRVLNDLACYLDATKRYKKGISLDELMGKIEEKLMDYRGYFVIFVDEVDHVRRDVDTLTSHSQPHRQSLLFDVNAPLTRKIFPRIHPT